MAKIMIPDPKWLTQGHEADYRKKGDLIYDSVPHQYPAPQLSRRMDQLDYRAIWCGGWEHRLWGQSAEIPTLVLPYSGVLGKLLSFSVLISLSVKWGCY